MSLGVFLCSLRLEGGGNVVRAPGVVSLVIVSAGCVCVTWVVT